MKIFEEQEDLLKTIFCFMGKTSAEVLEIFVNGVDLKGIFFLKSLLKNTCMKMLSRTLYVVCLVLKNI